MKASPDAQRRLLELQAVDLRLDQLLYQEANLPENGQLAQLDAKLARARQGLADGLDRETELQRQVSRIEQDVEQARKRMDRDRNLLDSGSITSSRRLEELQHECSSLARRIAELEDSELELMERLETVAKATAAVGDSLSQVEPERAQVVDRREAVLAEIAGERGQLLPQRSELASLLPVDLAQLYEKLRSQQGGVGAARLARGRCEGCYLQVSPQEAARFREAASDEVLRCEECRRILVKEVD